MHRIGIDLGGTKIEGVLLDDSGRELQRIRRPTPQEEGYDAILARIRDIHDQLAAAIPQGGHTFGVGTPGGISARTGCISLSNTLSLNGRPVRSDLEALLARPVSLQNDANCFALAEAKLGAGRGHNTVFGVIMGTGCGGGIVHHGEVVIGRHFRGGEWGHMSIDPDGPLCYCGRRGCVESYISGGGLERRYEKRFGTRKRVPQIEAEYKEGQADATAFFNEFLENFGRAIANLITVLDPDIIVLGGGVSNCDALYSEGLAQVARCILGDDLTTPIVRHSLGDSAGVFGAALIGI